MLNIQDLAVRAISETPGGHLILFKVLDTYKYAIKAEYQNEATCGALVLERFEGGPPGPTFLASTDFCIDLGRKPILLWDGLPAAVSDDSTSAPPVGHIALVRSTRLLSGYLLANQGAYSRMRFYWDLATGKTVGATEPERTAYISLWRLGLTDEDGRFKGVASSPEARPTPALSPK